MGGSNSGGGGFGSFLSGNYYGEEVDSTSCANLSFTTDLASVDPGVLASVKIGDVCDVVATTAKGPVIVSVRGERLGTILHMKDVQLLTCIFEGAEYKAKVLIIDGGRCQVLISAQR